MEWGLLGSLAEAERREVLAAARRRRFIRGEVVFHEGDPGDTLHLIAKGHVAVRIATPLGDTALLRVLGAGQYFGELAVVAPAPRSATIVCLEVVETLALHSDVLEELRLKHPAVEGVLTHALVAEVRRVSGLLIEALYLPVDCVVCCGSAVGASRCSMSMRLHIWPAESDPGRPTLQATVESVL